MFFKKDERMKTAKRIAIRYTYCFQVILIFALFITSNVFKKLILLPPLKVFNSSLYISFSISPDISIIITTQILVLFAAQAIFNKRLGGPTQPIVSGTAGFRLMDERERIVSDKAIFITFLYANLFLVTWTIIDIFIRGKFGVSFIIVALQFIFYSIAKVILLHHYGEDIS